LNNVATTLRADCERLPLWIHSYSVSEPLPPMITPRDRQQADKRPRRKTLRVVPLKDDNQTATRRRDQKFQTKMRSP
jgi:hypothetical protein